SLVTARPIGSPFARSPASLPTFSCECTQTPTRSRSGRRRIVVMAIDPMPPVAHTTTRYVILFLHAGSRIGHTEYLIRKLTVADRWVKGMRLGLRRRSRILNKH